MKNSFIPLLLICSLPLLLSAQPQFNQVFGEDPFQPRQQKRAKLFELNTLDPISKSWGKPGARALAELKQMYSARGEYSPAGTLQTSDIDAMFGILLPEQFAAPSADAKISADDYQQLIQGLGAKAYKTRQNSTQRLLAVGPQDDPKKLLSEATRNADPEIRLRAIEIRTAWLAGSAPAPNLYLDGFSNGFRRLVKSEGLQPAVKQRILEHGLSMMDDKKGAPRKLQRLLTPVVTAVVQSGTPTQIQQIKDTLLNTPADQAAWCFSACMKSAKSEHFGDILLLALRSKKPPLIRLGLDVVSPEMEGARAALDELRKEEAWSDPITLLLAGKFKDEKIFTGMVEEVLKLEEAEAKKAALQQLSKVGRYHGKIPAELLGHLLPIAKNPKSELRRPAINCLSGFRDPGILKPLFEIYLDDPKKMKAPVAKAFRNFPKEGKKIIEEVPDTAEAKDAVKRLKRMIENVGDPFFGGQDPFGGGADPFAE